MKPKRVYVAGHNGMVGSAICRHLKQFSCVKLVVQDRTDLDLLNQREVANFFAKSDIDEVYLAAAKVGGIYANNNYPADFIYQNITIQSNVIHSAFLNGVTKLVFLGSSCIYPRLASQPISENALLTGVLEPTNEPYAIAKIAGIKLCESYNRQYGDAFNTDYRSVMPTNLYGPGDNYDKKNSHVIPALIRRFHEAKISSAKSVEIWGTGKPLREFLHVDDMASACVHIMGLDKNEYNRIISARQSHINVGCGSDISISDLATLIAKVIGYNGQICFDPSKPDGPPRKLLNSSKLTGLGWAPTYDLEFGITKAYRDFVENIL